MPVLRAKQRLAGEPAAHHRGDAEQRRWPLLLAVAILIPIPLLALVVVLAGPDSQSAAPAQARSSEPAAGARCPDSHGSLRVLSAAPATEWQLVGTMAAPTSAAAGPATRDKAGYGRCFAHSTEGALFAAAHFWAASTSPQLGGRRAMRAWLADTPDRARELADPANDVRTDGQHRMQIRGFRIDQGGRGDVLLSLALGVEGSPSFAEVQSTMRWQDGDWRVVAPGEDVPSSFVIDSLFSFVKWGGA